MILQYNYCLCVHLHTRSASNNFLLEYLRVVLIRPERQREKRKTNFQNGIANVGICKVAYMTK